MHTCTHTHRTNVPIEGANAVVIGRSNIVGIPVAMMLLHRNATVTICHSRTQDLRAKVCVLFLYWISVPVKLEFLL